ncbi:VOC family protein [Massilia sp. W12]|uniref:VOC family protein n=1 Tax=Massilia sp. W12 TaxID=3126507 RepID=UPI0030D0720F
MPQFDGIDHVHIYVNQRSAALEWYARVLQLYPVPQLMSWAQGGGPLTIADAGNQVHLALFEASPQGRQTTVAFGVSAPQYMAWRSHLQQQQVSFTQQDHDLSWSLYFADPDGNRYEITCYAYAELAALLKAGA